MLSLTAIADARDVKTEICQHIALSLSSYVRSLSGALRPACVTYCRITG